MLEGEQPTQKTQLHLDRCLTCRNCESTCPSGVEYGHLVDIGRRIVEEKVPRGASANALRWTLKEGLPSPLFAPAMKMGQAVRGLLPKVLQAKVPARQQAGRLPTREHARKVLMLAGCVQPSMMPNINSATARVLDAAGIQTLVAALGGLLRRGEVPPQRPGGRPRADARQHRRLVAVRGKRQGRGDRDERVRLRRHGARIRALPAARRGVLGQGPAHQRTHARPERVAAGHRAGAARQGEGAGRPAGLPSAVQPAAWAATARRRREISRRARLHRAGGAGRIAPVLRLGRHVLRAASGDRARIARPQARPPGRARAHRPSCRRTWAASRTCRAAPGRRCGIGWRYWTSACAPDTTLSGGASHSNVPPCAAPTVSFTSSS